MKKIILTVVVLATTFSFTRAQVNFGVKGGIGLFNFSGSDASDGDFKSKVGILAAVYAAIPISENFAVTPELQFSGQGAKGTDLGIDFEFNLNYLNIPVMFQYRNEGGFFAEAGPQIGFLMSAKVKAEGTDEDIKDSFKSTAFSLGIGAGYKSSMGLGISARYALNLNNILDDPDGDLKNSGFQIGLIYEFGGKKSSKD